MKKQMINFVLFGVGFVVVMLGMMFIYGNNIENAGRRVQGAQTEAKITQNKTISPSIELQYKEDNPPAGVARDSQDAKGANDFYESGLKYLDSGKFQEAVSDFSDAIELDAMQADYYLKKSEAQYRMGDKESAIRTLDEGLKVLPSNNLLLEQREKLR